MRIALRTILLPLLSVLLAICTLAEKSKTQSKSSGATETRHDAIIKGVVTSENGKPLQKAHITLVNLATEEKTEAQTDKTGRFRFSQLFSGKYRLEATAGKDQTATDEFSLGPGETAVRKLVVKRQG